MPPQTLRELPLAVLVSTMLPVSDQICEAAGAPVTVCIVIELLTEAGAVIASDRSAALRIEPSGLNAQSWLRAPGWTACMVGCACASTMPPEKPMTKLPLTFLASGALVWRDTHCGTYGSRMK